MFDDGIEGLAVPLYRWAVDYSTESLWCSDYDTELLDLVDDVRALISDLNEV